MRKSRDGEGWLSGSDERKWWRGLRHVGWAVTTQRQAPAPALSIFAFFLKDKKTQSWFDMLIWWRSVGGYGEGFKWREWQETRGRNQGREWEWALWRRELKGKWTEEWNERHSGVRERLPQLPSGCQFCSASNGSCHLVAPGTCFFLLLSSSRSCPEMCGF